MSKLIIGLVGPLASGKGTVKKYLVEKYQAKDCRFSTVMRDVLTRIGVDISRENLQTISTTLRQNFGEDVFAKVLANDARQLDSEIVVVDGVRRLDDIKYLKQLPGFVLVAVDAPLESRYKRSVLRNENKGDDIKTIEQFKIDHLAEPELKIPEVMSQAQTVLSNSEDLAFLYNQVDELIRNLRS